MENGGTQTTERNKKKTDYRHYTEKIEYTMYLCQEKEEEDLLSLRILNMQKF